MRTVASERVCSKTIVKEVLNEGREIIKLCKRREWKCAFDVEVIEDSRNPYGSTSPFIHIIYLCRH